MLSPILYYDTFVGVKVRKKLQFISFLLITLFLGQFFPRLSANAFTVQNTPNFKNQPTKQGDLPIFYDLNGDKRPDQVQLFSTSQHKSIYITFGRGDSKQLHFDVPVDSSGFLFAADIDNDDYLDLIWLAQNEPNSAVIWRGDGRGNFTIVKDTTAYRHKLSQLSLCPFKPGVVARVSSSNPGCLSRTNIDFALSNGAVEPFTVSENLIDERTSPITGLDACLAQLQNRPPPFLS